MRTLAGLVVLAAALVLSTAAPAPAAAAPPAEAAWHEDLLDAVAVDLAAGRPLVVMAHVPLCSNDIIRCGNHGLGDGDAPAKNLYWATSGGFLGWFGRKGSGWTALPLDGALPDADVLAVRAWKRTITPGKAWKARGVKRPFDVVVVAFAWRGTAIDRTVVAYVKDLYGDAARTVTTKDGVAIAAGGAAHVVAWVGHNRFMDYAEAFGFPAEGSARPKGHIALACRTEAYVRDATSAPARVPLLMTRDFLFAGAHAFEGAVTAFAAGGSLADVRARAAQQYADGQKKDVKKVGGAFSNPTHPRWGK